MTRKELPPPTRIKQYLKEIILFMRCHRARAGIVHELDGDQLRADVTPIIKDMQVDHPLTAGVTIAILVEEQVSQVHSG